MRNPSITQLIIGTAFAIGMSVIAISAVAQSLGRANAGSPDEPLYPDFGNRIPAQRSSAAQGLFSRRPIQVSLSHTEDLERLRRQVERALRLARGINDERAAQALRAHAADLLEQVKSVEQQEQLSKDENKKD